MFSIFIQEYLQATKINNKLTIRSKMKGIPKYRQIVYPLWSWYICKRFRLCGCVIWQVLLTLCRGRGLFERDNHPMPRYWEKFSHIFAERYMLMLILLFVPSQSNGKRYTGRVSFTASLTSNYITNFTNILAENRTNINLYECHEKIWMSCENISVKWNN